jgi:hypothetical protein
MLEAKWTRENTMVVLVIGIAAALGFVALGVGGVCFGTACSHPSGCTAEACAPPGILYAGEGNS